MNSCDKFLALYNELDDILREKYHERDRSKSVIVRAVNDLNRTGNSEYIQLAKSLNMIRVLRNNLIHELDMNSLNLIEITSETLEEMEKYIVTLRNPKTAKTICTPLKDIYSIKFDDTSSLESIIRVMREKGFSQVPILNHQNLVKGVFSPNVIFDYVSKVDGVDLEKLTINDLKDCYPLDKHFSESYDFVKEDMIEEEIDDLFADAYQENKKLVMVFVTKNGKNNEPIVGIIVIKDLISSGYYLDK